MNFTKLTPADMPGGWDGECCQAAEKPSTEVEINYTAVSVAQDPKLPEDTEKKAKKGRKPKA